MRLPSKTLAHLRSVAEQSRIPLHAAIETTKLCNINCQHCYLQGQPKPTIPELSLEEIKTTLAQLKQMQAFFLTLTGGEIFLRPDALAILRLAQENSFVTTILTNGTLIDRSLARSIAETLPFQVHISLLGLQKTHDRITRKQGSFTQTIAAMDALREFGVKVVAKLVITKIAVQEVEQLQQLAAEHADDLIMSIDLIPSLSGSQISTRLGLSCTDLQCLSSQEKSKKHQRPEPNPTNNICNAARNYLAISSFGEVLPCLTFRKAIGNIRQQPIREIWNNPEMLEVCNLTQGDLQECRQCNDRTYCAFCPALAWLEYGATNKAATAVCERARRWRDYCSESDS